MSSTALSVSGLTKRFGRRSAVDDLNIELPSGVVAGFVGPNGAGKTTTMAMLLGLVRPTSGTGTVLGHSIADPAGISPVSAPSSRARRSTRRCPAPRTCEGWPPSAATTPRPFRG